MSAIFLSASIPVAGRGDYYESADPFLIQFAVREFVTTALGRRLIVWGGHPAITPMVWAVCEDLGIDFSKAVVLYQSKYFEDFFPEENKHFGNVEFVDAMPNDQEASLRLMRKAMLSRDDLAAAVFIGGMEGILTEHSMFTEFHPTAKVLAVPAPGGAARQLAKKLGGANEVDLQNVDFARLFHVELNVSPDEPRTLVNAPKVKAIEPTKAPDKKLLKRQKKQSTATLLKVTERRSGDVTILDLRGEVIGQSSLVLRDAVRNLTEAGNQKILVNLAGVSYIDSSGIGELMANYTMVHRQGGRLKLLNLTDKIHNLLIITKLLTVFDSYDNEAEALQAFE